MNCPERGINCLQIHWSGFFYFFSVLILLPLLFLEPVMEWRAIFITLWCFIWFVAEPMAVAIIGLIPITVIPLLGILDSNKICMCFARDANLLFVSCNFIAVIMQYSGLVKRNAFYVLSHFSCNPKIILLILMVFSYVLTAFLPASFVCAVMMPTIRAILQYLDDISVCKAINEEVVLKDDENPYPSKVAIAFYIGVAYAINIGSITTLLASDTGMVLRDLMKTEPSLADLSNDFLIQYTFFSLPVSLVILIFTIFYLEYIYLGFGREESVEAQQITYTNEDSKGALDKVANDLPSLNMHITWVVLLFLCDIISVIICAIVSPKVNNKSLKYSVNGMLLCFFYFVLPRNFDFCNYFRCTEPTAYKPTPSVLPWAPVSKITPWKGFFIHGSSLAFGTILKTAKVHVYVADGLLKTESQLGQQLGFIFVSVIMTIMCSSDIVAEMMLSLSLKDLGDKNAAILFYPILWACCLTFLLPVSSPANAFAMSWGELRAKDMIFAAIGPTVVGFLVAVIGCLII